MKHYQPFLRKVLYLGAMALLLYPLSMLGQPAGRGGNSPGGVLAQIRLRENLSYAELGEIDPTSEALKLATLGLRCVAVDLLWEKAYRYQITEDWNNLSATLEQIARLQPHFINVWRFQGWNLSFNVSVEWDDYRDRYYWVIRGIKFLDQGQRYNQRDIRLFWDEGWFTGYKIGRADEYRQFRRLFREDKDFFDWFDPNWAVDRRDNWLVARESFLEAVNMVDNRGVPRKGIDPYLFFSEPAKVRMHYAAALEEEGTFGNTARNEWELAHDAWTYGRRSAQLDRRDIGFGIRRFVTPSGHPVYILELDQLLEEQKQLVQKIESLTQGVREKVRQQKIQQLPEDQRRIVTTPIEQLNESEKLQRRSLELRLLVTPYELAEHAPEPVKQEALKLRDQLLAVQEKIREVRTARSIVNYEYWEQRCQAERSSIGLKARELLYQAYLDYQKDPITARESYEAAFAAWREVLDKYELLMEDPGLLDDLIAHIRRYEDVLKRYDEPFPDDFILRDVLIKRPPEVPIGNFGMKHMDLLPPEVQ